MNAQVSLLNTIIPLCVILSIVNFPIYIYFVIMKRVSDTLSELCIHRTTRCIIVLGVLLQDSKKLLTTRSQHTLL